MTNCFENILISSKRSPNFIETDHGKEFSNKIFTDFLNEKNIKRYSRYNSLGAALQNALIVIAEIFSKGFFLKGDDNWIDIMPSKTKQHDYRIHFSTKLTPKQASLKNNENYFLPNFIRQKKANKTKK